MTTPYSPDQLAHALTLRIGAILDLDALVLELANAVRDLTGCERAVLFAADDENATLSTAAIAPQGTPLNRTFSIFNQDDIYINHWLADQSFAAAQIDLTAQSLLYHLAQALQMEQFYSLPLHAAGRLIGVILIDNPTSRQSVKAAQIASLNALKASASIALANARRYSKTVTELDTRMSELTMMRQIDRELSDTIRLDRVFDLTLDWALRFTLAQYASLALFDESSDDLRFVANLGYDAADQFGLRASYGGIAQRVARTGRAEMIPDTTHDSDYVAVSSAVRSHMSVPVMREDHVIAVITLESRRLNAFTDAHLDFVAKLAVRAGVALDNARLYAEAVREREKLSHILSEIADVVIVVGHDDRVILINQSAIAALRLYPDVTYVGRLYTDAFENTPLLPGFAHAKNNGQITVEEVALDDKRSFYAEFSPQREIGWIIVMHDITPLKQTDELKRELVATVSHDLKQPLSVMNGYLELLQMSQHMDPRGENFARMIARSIEHMRHLIDDVLDLAKIESGIAFEIQPVRVDHLIARCIEWIKPVAEAKSMRIETDVPANLPPLAGDPERLMQIFNNLIGNAVKYTQPEGEVKISVERLDRNLRFTVQDNGIGISPEDQAHIFDRFYRVRRPETENIEGSGLGLAIVKKLIDAHKGQIGLESNLGEGTTFYITLPIYGS